jgi:hypothetical protein
MNANNNSDNCWGLFIFLTIAQHWLTSCKKLSCMLLAIVLIC